jgi:uncharacterized protein YfdQ (DUF2303 family)
MNTTETIPAAQATFNSPAMTVPDAFIEAIKQGQEITAACDAVCTATNALANGIVALPDSMKVHDLEHALPTRRHARGTMNTPFVEPFAQYTKQHAEAGACVFIHATDMQATAVLNLGEPDQPGHADNLAKLTPIKTAAYQALLAITRGPINQQQAAEFFEDWAGELEFYTDDAQITPKQAVGAVRRITIEALAKIESEEQSLSANRSAFESVTASSKEPIPTRIYFKCQPYADLASRTFVLRLGVLTGEKTPRLVLRMLKAEEHAEEMAEELGDLIRAAIGSLPVLTGQYSKAQ